MQRLRRALSVVALAAVAVSGFANENSGATRAGEVLKQARAAVGGEERLRGVQGLTIKGKFRRVAQEREQSGEREFDFLLPDSFMRTESVALPGMTNSMTTERAVSGGQFWSSGGRRRGGMVFVMRGDGQEPTPEQKAQAEREQARQMRAEMARYLLALLLTAPPDFPVEFKYAGEATAADGSAHVIDASGPDGFSARLFLDKQTHLPLMLSYRAPRTRVFTMTMRQDAGGKGKSPEEMLKEAQEKMKAEGEAKPEEVEMQLRFEDYRESAGLMLPHRITSGADGETTEEFEVKSYTLNPRFKADKFQKK